METFEYNPLHIIEHRLLRSLCPWRRRVWKWLSTGSRNCERSLSGGVSAGGENAVGCKESHKQDKQDDRVREVCIVKHILGSMARDPRADDLDRGERIDCGRHFDLSHVRCCRDLCDVYFLLSTSVSLYICYFQRVHCTCHMCYTGLSIKKC